MAGRADAAKMRPKTNIKAIAVRVYIIGICLEEGVILKTDAKANAPLIRIGVSGTVCLLPTKEVASNDSQYQVPQSIFMSFDRKSDFFNFTTVCGLYGPAQCVHQKASGQCADKEIFIFNQDALQLRGSGKHSSAGQAARCINGQFIRRVIMRAKSSDGIEIF